METDTVKIIRNLKKRKKERNARELRFECGDVLDERRRGKGGRIDRLPTRMRREKKKSRYLIFIRRMKSVSNNLILSARDSIGKFLSTFTIFFSPLPRSLACVRLHAEYRTARKELFNDARSRKTLW